MLSAAEVPPPVVIGSEYLTMTSVGSLLTTLTRYGLTVSIPLKVAVLGQARALGVAATSFRVALSPITVYCVLFVPSPRLRMYTDWL